MPPPSWEVCQRDRGPQQAKAQPTAYFLGGYLAEGGWGEIPIVSAEKLVRITREIFLAAGASSYEADTVSKHLVKANLRGVDSHGVIRVPRYVEEVKTGRIRLHVKNRIIRETPSTVLIDGNYGFGQVTCKEGMETAIMKAKEAGTGTVAIYNCNHIGSLSDYAMMATAQGMIGACFANSVTVVAPPGGTSAELGTNPICYAIPAGSHAPIVLDMATSITTFGKLLLLKSRGEKAPEGWLFDHEGKPIVEPGGFFGPPRGAMLPFGGYKGYGLCLILEILGGGLSGAGCGVRLRGHNGVFLQVLRIDCFQPLEEFTGEVGRLIDSIKSSRRLAADSEIMIPGEPEQKTEEHRSREGVPLDEATWNALRSTGVDLGVPF